MSNSILITGAYGVLGTKLRAHFPEAFCPTEQELDITNPLETSFVATTVLHCAAVKTVVCDQSPLLAMKVNVVGTANVAEYCHRVGARMIYISTDYVFKGDRGDYKPGDEVCPQNYYAETKLAGEYVVKCLPKYLIIRLSFFPDIYPYDGGFTDQWTTKIPVSEAAARIAKLVNSDTTGVVHICGPKRTVYEYALATANGRKFTPMSIEGQSFKRPKDTSLMQG